MLGCADPQGGSIVAERSAQPYDRARRGWRAGADIGSPQFVDNKVAQVAV